MDKAFEVVVVGGGHAGVEAACAAARMGARTLLVTHQIATVGVMSCNPAMGGIGKGHLIKEIDALGGIMPRATDRAGIHWRVLNASKGPAVRATRAQADRVLYQQAVWDLVQHTPNLFVVQQAVEDITLDPQGHVATVVGQNGMRWQAKAVVLTNGTFLNGKIHVGLQQHSGGRSGEPASVGLATMLRQMLPMGRLKTGTPPRLDKRTLNWDILDKQPSQWEASNPIAMSMWQPAQPPAQIECAITHTNDRVHDIIRANLHQSPMYAGVIEGVGPRYCPSIEDKVMRFADKASHQIFLEPEGLSTYEVYPNGISTSLPYDVQEQIIHAIPGLERAHITRPGYAIEYDYANPQALRASLESQHVPGLFLAGQINGTTGYEEAGAQGIMAGINAARHARQQDPFILQRHQAYIGVLIDDLITHGTTEPYRMFTSRAEHRLLLREDNADHRLTPQGRQLGVVGDEQWACFERHIDAIARVREHLERPYITPHTPQARPLMEAGVSLSKEETPGSLLRRPDITYSMLAAWDLVPDAPPRAAAHVQIALKYEGYIARQQQDIEQRSSQENTPLPEDLDYAAIKGLSAEMAQKWAKLRPQTVGQASRVPGSTPSDVSVLLVHVAKRRRQSNALSLPEDLPLAHTQAGDVK